MKRSINLDPSRMVSSARCYFLELPPELRLMIYDKIIGEASIEFHHPLSYADCDEILDALKPHNEQLKTATALLSTNREIFLESSTSFTSSSRAWMERLKEKEQGFTGEKDQLPDVMMTRWKFVLITADMRQHVLFRK